MQRSPYTPGQVAQEIYGRDQIIRDVQRELSFVMVEPHLVGRIEVFTGPRGVGKTSLLRAVQEYARSKGFETVFITAGDGPSLEAIIDEVETISSTWKGEFADSLRGLMSSLRVEIAGISVGGGGVQPKVERSNHGRKLQRLLVSAGELAAQRSKGLVLLIDEVQSADPEGLRALAYAWQHMQSENNVLPMAVFAAGLSHSQDIITDAVSFAERFRYRYLGNLTEGEASEALRNPSRAKGVDWSEEALAGALALAGGYPYFLQVIGDATWAAAGHPGPGTIIELPQLEGGIAEFENTRSMFFRARWQKATPAEANFLRAMAAAGEMPVRRSAIAEAMGKNTNDISMARRSLLDKGLIDVSGHGFVEFTAPGFAEFIREEAAMT